MDKPLIDYAIAEYETTLDLKRRDLEIALKLTEARQSCVSVIPVKHIGIIGGELIS